MGWPALHQGRWLLPWCKAELVAHDRTSQGSTSFCPLASQWFFRGVMEKATERKNLVKELRAFVRQIGATQVRDDSSRTRIEAMFQSIVAKAAANTKSKATELLKSTSRVSRLSQSGARELKFSPVPPPTPTPRDEPKSSLRCSESFDSFYK